MVSGIINSVMGVTNMSAQLVHAHVSDDLKVKLGTWLTMAFLTAVSFTLAYFLNSTVVGAAASSLGALTGRAPRPEYLDSAYSWMAVGYLTVGVITLAGLLRGSVRFKR